MKFPLFSTGILFLSVFVLEDQTSRDIEIFCDPISGQRASKDCSSLIVDQEPSENKVDTNSLSAHGGEVELRCVPHAADNSEVCSTSNTNQPINSLRRLKKIRSRGFGLQGRHKRWKGRVEILGNFPGDQWESNKATVEEEEVF